MVDVGQIASKHAVERVLGPVAAIRPADTASSKPIRVRRHILVILMDMVNDVVLEHANAMSMRGLDHAAERFFAAQSRVDLTRTCRPITMITRNLMHTVAGQ